MFGLLKPKFYSIYDGSASKTSAIVTVDHYLQ
jgi:hypothetical protein